MEEKIKNISEERTQEVEEVKKDLKELLEEEKVKNMIKNNVIEFTYEDKKYRVRKPTYLEKQDIYLKRCEKQIELLEAKTPDGKYKYRSEKELKDLYLSRGTNVDKMINRIKYLSLKEKEFLDKLGKELKETQNKQQLDYLTDEIKKVRDEINRLADDKNSLMEFSVESQLLNFIYTYFTYLVTEKEVDGKWIKAWNSFDEMYKTEEVMGLANTYIIFLLNNQV